MKTEPKGTTSFTPPADELLPAQGPQKTAEPYGERARRREAVEQVKGKGPPLGGAPPIPPGKLQQLVGGGGMPSPSFEDDGPPDVKPPDQPARPIVPGIGSAYAVNQAMAQGEIDAPVSMSQAKEMGLGGSVRKGQPLSEESVQALRATKNSMEIDQDTTSRMEQAERQIVDDGKKDSSLTVPFDFDSIMRAQNPLMNDNRKKVIESRLEDMSLDDMIMKREIQQVIPIVPDRFVLTLRTFNQRELLWILSYLYEFPGSPVHNEQLLNTFKLVLSVVAINGKLLPDHRKNVGEMKEDVDRDQFTKKMFHIASFPVQMVADIGVQCNWFNDRINKLLTYENVKNG